MIALILPVCFFVLGRPELMAVAFKSAFVEFFYNPVEKCIYFETHKGISLHVIHIGIL
jgi:hypothetical protein